MICWMLAACGTARAGRGQCPNWAPALRMARDIAACDGHNRAKPGSRCVAAIKSCPGGCDVCQFLGGPKELKVVVADPDEWAPIERVPITSRNPNGYDGLRCLPGVGLFSRKYKFNWHLCNDKDAADILASTIVHEAMHECVSVQWPGILDHRVTTPAGCSAEELENICAGK